MKYLLALAILFSAEGFAPTFQRPSTTATTRLSPLWYVNTDLPDVAEMRAGEMKQVDDDFHARPDKTHRANDSLIVCGDDVIHVLFYQREIERAQ